MNIRRSTVLPVIIIAVAAMIAMSLIAGMSFFATGRKDAILASSLEVGQHTAGVSSGIIRAQTYAEELLDMTRLVPQEIANVVIEAELAQINRELNALLHQELPETLRNEAKKLAVALDDWRDKAFVLLGVTPAADIPTHSALSTSSEAVRRQANHLSQLAGTYAEQAFMESNRNLSKVFQIGLSGTAFFMGVAITLSMWRARAISGSMQLAASRLGSLASKEQPSTEKNSDEVAAVFDALDTLEISLEEKTRIQERLRVEKMRAEAATETKSRFLATMSHEIRTPINGVLGMAQILHETELGPEQKTCADTILASSEALLRIVNDILDFSKLESEKNQLIDQPFDLSDIVYDVATLMSPGASAKGVEICLDMPHGLPSQFTGDSDRMRQILMNLVGNAVKFTLKGHVCVKFRYDARRDFPICISVEDTGVGIPKDSLGQVFQAFEQVESTVTRRFEGTGLGLAISSRLAKAMGGEITVSSELDKGSRFDVHLNLPVAAERLVEAKPLAGKSIVVAAEMQIPKEVHLKQLEEWGAQTWAAGEVHELCELTSDLIAQGRAPDAVVLDGNLPVAHAKDLYDELRSQMGHRRIPILFCTGGQQLSAYDALKDGELVHLVAKPVRSSALLSGLLEAMGGVVEALPTPKFTDATPIKVLNNLRILVAEDNQTNQLVLRKMLKPTGAQLTLCADGREVTDAFFKDRYDIVLMDMSMPVMDGLEATQHIQKWERRHALPSTPIIALTANVLQSDQEACRAAGMNDFLTKPFKKPQLIETILKWTAQELQIPKEKNSDVLSR